MSKNRTPEVLGSAPLLAWRGRGCRSDWFGGTAVKQTLSVLCGGEGGVGSSGWLMPAAVLPFLQEEIANDGQDHHDADPEEHSNHYLKGTCRGTQTH